jgi:hypothetical protein
MYLYHSSYRIQKQHSANTPDCDKVPVQIPHFPSTWQILSVLRWFAAWADTAYRAGAYILKIPPAREGEKYWPLFGNKNMKRGKRKRGKYERKERGKIKG